MPQNPTRQVHALLGGFVQDALIDNQNHDHKTDKIIARTLLFSKNQKNCDLPKRWQKKDFAKQTRTQILENLTLPKCDNAKENEIILQTQLTWNFAKKDTPILRAYKTNHEQNRSNETKPIKTYADRNQSRKTLTLIFATR